MIEWINIKQVLPKDGQKVLIYDGDYRIVTFNKDDCSEINTYWAKLDTPEECAQEMIIEFQRDIDALLREIAGDKYFRKGLLPCLDARYISQRNKEN